MSYRKSALVTSFPAVDEELRQIERSQYDALDLMQLKVLHAAPSKYQKGTIVYADGTNWNPGSGEGVYVYKSGWVLLG